MGKTTKKTHEEFLQDLWERNEHYRNGDFEILGKYVGNSTKILLEDKHGKCLIKPSSLSSLNTRPSIKSAIDKTQYWKNMCLERFGEEGNDDLSQVEYIKGSIKVKVIDREFGEYWITPHNYYTGKRSMKRKRSNCLITKLNDQKEVFDKIRKLHPELEILPNQEYKGANKHILVKNKYGICRVVPNHLLKRHAPSIVSSIDKTSYCINQFKEKHGDRYDYSLVEYINDRIKVKIISEHGVFEQTPNNHLQGEGCPIEAYKNVSKRNKENPVGWRYETWIKSAEKSKYFDSYKVYFIECWDEETGEHFYKIGKTYKTVKRRFRTKNKLPYNYNIIYTIELDDARRICELEQGYQNKNKEYNYTPKKKFDGMYECFSKLIEI